MHEAAAAAAPSPSLSAAASAAGVARLRCGPVACGCGCAVAVAVSLCRSSLLRRFTAGGHFLFGPPSLPLPSLCRSLAVHTQQPRRLHHQHHPRPRADVSPTAAPQQPGCQQLPMLCTARHALLCSAGPPRPFIPIQSRPSLSSDVATPPLTVCNCSTDACLLLISQLHPTSCSPISLAVPRTRGRCARPACEMSKDDGRRDGRGVSAAWTARRMGRRWHFELPSRADAQRHKSTMPRGRRLACAQHRSEWSRSVTRLLATSTGDLVQHLHHLTTHAPQHW